MHLSLSQKIFALVLVPLAFTMILLGILAFFLERAEIAATREAHAKEVRQRGVTITHFAENAMLAVFEYSQSKNSQYLEAVKDARSHLKTEIDSLENLVAGNQTQRDVVSTLRRFSDRLEGDTLALEKAPSENLYQDLWLVVREMKILLRTLTIYESRSSSSSVNQAHENRQRVEQTLVLGAIAIVILAAIMVAFFVRPIITRLTILKDNNQKLARQEPLLPAMPGTDEIAQIDRGFHDMADALAEYVRKEQAMVENATDIICSLDREKNFLKINRACLDRLGYEATEMTSKPLGSFLTEDTSCEQIDQVLRDKNSSTFELPMRRLDGTEATLLWTAHWSERDEALFCVLHDITERKRIEQLKQEFVAMVSHDLRSPLTSIQLSLGLLKGGTYGELPERAVSTILRAERNTLGLIGLINEILDISKIESGKMTLAQAETAIAPIFERSGELVRNLAEKKSITIKFPETTASANIDGDRIVQVMTNLLSNAIKYSPPDESVSVAVEHEPNSLKVLVSDKGKGIPKEMHEAIFDRFKQVELADSKVLGGSGLGLSICKLIVEAHGGQIGVDSEVGAGSAFWFIVPTAT